MKESGHILQENTVRRALPADGVAADPTMVAAVHDIEVREAQRTVLLRSSPWRRRRLPITSVTHLLLALWEGHRREKKHQFESQPGKRKVDREDESSEDRGFVRLLWMVLEG